MEDRQDIVVDQDLKNGLSSTLEFCAEAHRLAGNEKGRQYLLQVSRDITSGRGHPAPNPGPVTPPTGILGARIGNTEGNMDRDTGRTVVSAALTLLVAIAPGAGEAIDAAVGSQAEATAVIIGMWALVHGLVHFVHNYLGGTDA